MKTKLALLLLTATLSSAAHASRTILPDACGADNVKFDVEIQKDQPAPAPPPEGKAQIVFIETLEKTGNIIGTPTVRFGMDGAWVGADKGNAYFVLSVSPGEHHLCSNWAKSVGIAGPRASA